MGNKPPGYTVEAEDAPLMWNDNNGYAWFALVFGVIVLLGGLFGNILVLALVISRRDFHKVYHFFISLLAVGDIVILLSCMPWTLYSFYYDRNWIWGNEGCQAIMFFQGFAVLLSMFTFWAMAIERYMIIAYPVDTRIEWTKRHAGIACFLIVLFSTCFAMPRPFKGGMLEYRDGNNTNTFCLENIPDNVYLFYYNIFRVLFFYVIPLVHISIMYSRIIRVLRADTCSNTNLVQSRKKMVKMLIAMVIIFAVCWLPYHAFLVIQIVPYGKTILGMAWFHYMFIITSVFMYIHCISNPIIYTLMSSTFRVGFKRLICCCLMPPEDRGPWTSRRSTNRSFLATSRSSERDRKLSASRQESTASINAVSYGRQDSSQQVSADVDTSDSGTANHSENNNTSTTLDIGHHIQTLSRLDVDRSNLEEHNRPNSAQYGTYI